MIIRPLQLAIRLLFISFFAISAWNTLHHLDQPTLSLKRQYARFEKTFTDKTSLRFPSFMSAGFINKYGDCILETMAWTQLALCAVALFFLPGLTVFIGLLNLLTIVIQFFVSGEALKMRFGVLEPFVIGVSLLAASMVVSFPSLKSYGGKMMEWCHCCRSKENVRYASEQRNKKKA